MLPSRILVRNLPILVMVPARNSQHLNEEEKITAPATLIVSLPAGARLLIDDQPTASNTSQRVFVTPPLQRGHDYVYNLKATVQRGDRPATMTRTVTVRAGESVRVNLDVP